MIPSHIWMIEFGGQTGRTTKDKNQSLYSYVVNKQDWGQVAHVGVPPVRRNIGREGLASWFQQHKNFPPPRHSPTMLVNTSIKCPEWQKGYGDENFDETHVTRSYTPTPCDGHIRDDSSEDSFHSAASSTTKANKRAVLHEFRGTMIRYQTPFYPHQADQGHSIRNNQGGGTYQRGRQRKFLNRNYHSQYYIPPDRFLNHGHLVHVSESPPQPSLNTDWDQLSKSIWKMFIANQQTLDTYKQKIMLWKELFIFIRSSFPKHGLFLVGSTMSGLGSNSSDVDMCLLVRYTEMDQRNEALLHLENVAHYLRQFDKIDGVNLIHAKVPILKLKSNGLEVDLNCNNAVGIRNTHLLYCYARADWRVRPLVLVVKLWAAHHDINDAKRMTVSSYSWALMVIHFLQCGTKPSVLPNLQSLYREKFLPLADINHIDLHEELPPIKSKNTDSLGKLFLGFLLYYSNFDYNHYAVSVRAAAKIPIEECRRARSLKNDPHQWKYLCIEEPFDLTNTARSVYDYSMFERVRRVLKASFEVLNATQNLDSIFDLHFRPQ